MLHIAAFLPISLTLSLPFSRYLSHGAICFQCVISGPTNLSGDLPPACLSSFHSPQLAKHLSLVQPEVYSGKEFLISTVSYGLLRDTLLGFQVPPLHRGLVTGVYC